MIPPGRLGIALLVLAVFAVYLVSPRSQLRDSRYCLLVSTALLSRGTLALDAWAPPPWGTPDARPVAEALPHTLVPVNGHVHYLYPPGTSLLALPFVAIADALGVSVVDTTGAYDRAAEKVLQHALAALVVALLVGVLYAGARLRLARGPALAVALGAAFATQLWSTASRALWSHTFEVLLVGLALVHLLRCELRGAPLRPVALATALAWSFFVRPTAAISVLAITAWVALRRPAALPRLLVAGAAWLAAFLALSWASYGSLLPPYYQPGRHELAPSAGSLLGLLVSPGRGLLVYVPLAAFVAGLVAWRWRRLEPRALAWTAVAASLGQLALLACFPVWWGGHCYGPRLLTGLVPWLAVLAVLALAAAPEGARRRLPPPAAAAGMLALAVGVAMNGAAAISSESMSWNSHPVDVDRATGRLWDWRDPPFLRWRQALAGDDR
jgi:hypothetical protein